MPGNGYPYVACDLFYGDALTRSVPGELLVAIDPGRLQPAVRSGH